MEQLKTKELRSIALSEELLSSQAAVAPRNRISSGGTASIGDQTAPTNVTVLAGIVTPRLGGHFRVDIDMKAEIDTATTLISVFLDVYSAASFPANLVNGTETASGSNVFALTVDAGGSSVAGLTFGGAVQSNRGQQFLDSVGVTYGFSVHLGDIITVNPALVSAFALRVTTPGKLIKFAADFSAWEQA